MYIEKNYNYISNAVKSLSAKTELIIVSKNQNIEKINRLIKLNHIHFGENRVQEASLKWKNLILDNLQLKLHEWQGVRHSN